MAHDISLLKLHIEKTLNYKFRDTTILQRAFTHRSFNTVNNKFDYERLEFLGDAVLGLCMAHLLSETYPKAPEGRLSKMRAALVNEATLSKIAKELLLGSFIRLSIAESSSGGTEKPSILADVMEALIGAVYKDANFDAAFEIVRNLFQTAVSTVTPTDPKTELQEILHTQGKKPPVYTLIKTEGPDHAPVFTTAISVDGVEYGVGAGNSKKDSQQNAAQIAICKLKTSCNNL